MLEKVRFGIIGAGTIAIEGHIPAIKDTSGAELVAICRRNREKAKKLAEEFGVPEVYYDYRDLVKSKNVDAIIVATPNAYHR
ncbi:Gfo/Idh/MocA family oxidoreductase, partial [Candidatus Aerophobetes bacterium]|nr:Gfo/Idh/MocA family oxidoreductase [Candidatus Aerophobetes bacterium]